jgi:L-seryl-tRNA(Ser) seleniumtransferase
MATRSYTDLESRAKKVLIGSGVAGQIVGGYSTLGAGSSPGAAIPSPLIECDVPDDVFLELLRAEPPILARRQSGRLLIDLRTVDPACDLHVAAALRSACQS